MSWSRRAGAGFLPAGLVTGTVCIVAVAGGGARAGHGVSAAARQSTAEARPGVFTSAQQARGEAIYRRECSTCHGDRLKGGEGAPALTGVDFMAGWNGKTAGDLFERVRLTMPAEPDTPGKLSRPQYADVVAHILAINGFPPGNVELPSDLEALNRIQITDPR